MPVFCAEPGCGVLVERGRCSTHARSVDLARGSRHERGYTYRWTLAAARFRERYPLCGMRPDGRPPVLSACYDGGRVTLATVVDHVMPHRGSPSLFWDEGNWQSLCAACHAHKTASGL